MAQKYLSAGYGRVNELTENDLEAMRMIKIWRNELNSLWWGRGSQQNRTH
jgi:hypothetical protein